MSFLQTDVRLNANEIRDAQLKVRSVLESEPRASREQYELTDPR
jgi:hypothetical protein